VVPEDDDIGFSWPFAQIAASEADVVMLVGARLKQRLGFGLPPRFSASARWIQIDIEPEEFHRNRRIDLPITADATLAVEQIVEVSRKAGYAHPGRHAWLRKALESRYSRLDELRSQPGHAVQPLELADAIAERLPDNAIVVGDGADIQNWMYASLRVRQAPGFLDHYPLGSMGIGTPLAVGAAAAARDIAPPDGEARPVVLITGDGSFGFYPSELNGVRLAGLPLVTVIGNDAAWGTEKHGQQQALGRTINTELGPCAYEHIARAFDCIGLRVTRRDELGQALDEAFAAQVPVVVNVDIDPEAGMVLKDDPLAKMIMFSDLAASLSME
jgi:acetolactate synthase-1/2/3 large subunit